MKKKEDIEIVIGAVFILVLVFARSMYLYLGEDMSVLEVLKVVGTEIGIFILLMAIGVFLSFVFTFITHRGK